jgi:hypothetical protein
MNHAASEEKVLESQRVLASSVVLVSECGQGLCIAETASYRDDRTQLPLTCCLQLHLITLVSSHSLNPQFSRRYISDVFSLCHIKLKQR